jgi:hypothetical protein
MIFYILIHLKNAINVKIDNKLKQMAATPCKINHIGILGFRGHKSKFCAPKFPKKFIKSV